MLDLKQNMDLQGLTAHMLTLHYAYTNHTQNKGFTHGPAFTSACDVNDHTTAEPTHKLKHKSHPSWGGQ